MQGVKQLLRKVKDQTYDPIEVKVRDATSSDNWGASTTTLAEIAKATNDYQEYPKLFAMVWKRLTDKTQVLHVTKSLILVDYLLRNGSTRFIEDCRDKMFELKALQNYTHYDANHEDDAKDARIKAKWVVDLLTDDNKLAEERAKAEKIKDVKNSGISSDNFAMIEAMHHRQTHHRDDDRDRHHNGDGDNHREHQGDGLRRPSGDENAAPIKRLQTEKKATESTPQTLETPKKPRSSAKKKATPGSEKKAQGSTPGAEGNGAKANTGPVTHIQLPLPKIDDFEVSFDPLDQSGANQGSASAAYQARAQQSNKPKDIVAEFEIHESPRPPVQPTQPPKADFDFLTQGNGGKQQQQAETQWTDLTPRDDAKGNTGKTETDWQDPFGEGNSNGNGAQAQQKNAPQAAQNGKGSSGTGDVWANGLVNFDLKAPAKATQRPPTQQGGPSMSEMRGHLPNSGTIFDDSLLSSMGGTNTPRQPGQMQHGPVQTPLPQLPQLPQVSYQQQPMLFPGQLQMQQMQVQVPVQQLPIHVQMQMLPQQQPVQQQINPSTLNFVVPQAKPSAVLVPDLLALAPQQQQQQTRGSSNNAFAGLPSSSGGWS